MSLAPYYDKESNRGSVLGLTECHFLPQVIIGHKEEATDSREERL